MSALKELAKRQPKLAPVISTLICVGIGWERAKSFAQAQQPNKENGTTAPENPSKASATEQTTSPAVTEKLDLPLPPAPQAAAASEANDHNLRKKQLLHTIPLELRAVQKYENIKSKQQACGMLEGKVVTYYDSSALVVNCVQRPVEDADLLNELVFRQRKPVAEIPAHVYRLIPFGEPWVANQSQNLTISKVCRDLNSHYITSTGTDYYFVEACKKRPFSTYVELQAHNKRNAPVLTVPPDQVDKIPTGPKLEGSYDREVGALYKIVGDSTLSPLSSGNTRKKPVTSAAELEELPEKSGRTKDSKGLCKDLNQKIVSFYSQIFFVTGCQKRPIREIPIIVQQRLAERGSSILDVSSKQLDSIPTGKELSEEEAISIIK
ncbi:hypothetical protein EBR21_03955 [bacterium]|nr:hypothetical protein [bacterium]